MIAGQGGGRAPGGTGGWRRPDASMSLLLDVVGGKLLDSGYADAAARRAAAGRAAGGAAPRRSRFGGGVLAVLVLAGLLLAVAGAEVRRGEPVAAERRARLIDQIHARTGEAAALQRRVDALRAETERRRAAALARGDAGRRARQRLAEAAAAAAAAPAAGSGFEVVLDDAPGRGRGGGDGDGGGRVYDQDLQIVVNGLWAAGARAVGINGLRITPTTAIRTAGEAVLVDYRPLRGPYEVTALGEPRRLREAFTGSAADRRMLGLHERYGIRYGTRRADEVRLPAAAAPRLRYAEPRR